MGATGVDTRLAVLLICQRFVPFRATFSLLPRAIWFQFAGQLRSRTVTLVIPQGCGRMLDYGSSIDLQV